MQLEHNKERFFYIIKLLRIHIGFTLLDPHALAEFVTSLNINVRIKKMIETDPVTADSTDEDNTYIDKILKFKYLIITSKLAFVILTISYFLGVVW